MYQITTRSHLKILRSFVKISDVFYTSNRLCISYNLFLFFFQVSFEQLLHKKDMQKFLIFSFYQIEIFCS